MNINAAVSFLMGRLTPMSEVFRYIYIYIYIWDQRLL